MTLINSGELSPSRNRGCGAATSFGQNALRAHLSWVQGAELERKKVAHFRGAQNDDVIVNGAVRAHRTSVR